jgi:hypothetical protein
MMRLILLQNASGVIATAAPGTGFAFSLNW